MMQTLAVAAFMAAAPAFAQIPVAAPPAPSSADLAAQARPQAERAFDVSPAQSWKARWSFLKEAAKNSDYAGAEPELVDDLDALAGQNPSADQAPQARFLAASLEEKEGLHQQTMVDLLRLLYEYPQSGVSLQAQSMFQHIANRRLPERFKSAILSAAQPASGAALSDRLASLINILVANFGSEFYEQTRAQIRSFMARFPDYGGMDQVQWNLARLQEAAGHERAALLDVQELLAVYPQSSLVQKARFEVGQIYAALRLYEKAVGAYQAFAAAYPQSSHAISALSQIATIFADHLDQYDMAIKTDEMIIAQSPQGRPAAEALYQESGLYDCHFLFFSCKLDDPAKALGVYQRIVDSGNLDFLDKSQAEHVRSRINSLTGKLAKAPAAPQEDSAAPAAVGQGR